MISKIIGKIHFAIIAYFIFGVYEKYIEHSDKIENLKNSQESKEAQVKKRQQDTATRELLESDVGSAKQRIENMAKELDLLKKKLPLRVSPEKDISLFESMINDVNMKNISVTSTGVKKEQSYVMSEYSITAQGTYLQLLIFLEKLAEMDRLLNVQSVILKTPEENVRGRYQVIDISTVVVSFSQDRIANNKSVE